MDETRKDLVKYRMDKAKENLDSANILLNDGKINKSITCSYYAMFFAAKAVLATKEIDRKTHKGVIIKFNEEFIKTDEIPKEYSKMLGTAKSDREEAEYADFIEYNEEEAKIQYNYACKFVEFMKNYLSDYLR